MRILLTIPVLLVAATVAPVAAQGPEAYEDLRPLLVAELERYEMSRPDDLYKFLYQGVMGPGHAIPDPEMARRWLEREWEAMPRSPRFGGADSTRSRPSLTVLRADSALVRIDLPMAWFRTLPAAPGNAEELMREAVLATFIETANTWTVDRKHVGELWLRVMEDVELWSGRIEPEDMDAFFAEVRAAGYPAVHHSEEYSARWSPHYRVVSRELWDSHDWSRP